MGIVWKSTKEGSVYKNDICHSISDGGLIIILLRVS